MSDSQHIPQAPRITAQSFREIIRDEVRTQLRDQLAPIAERLERTAEQTEALDRAVFGNDRERRPGLVRVVENLDETAKALTNHIAGAKWVLAALSGVLMATNGGPFLRFLLGILGVPVP